MNIDNHFHIVNIDHGNHGEVRFKLMNRPNFCLLFLLLLLFQLKILREREREREREIKKNTFINNEPFICLVPGSCTNKSFNKQTLYSIHRFVHWEIIVQMCAIFFPMPDCG